MATISYYWMQACIIEFRGQLYEHRIFSSMQASMAKMRKRTEAPATDILRALPPHGRLPIMIRPPLSLGLALLPLLLLLVFLGINVAVFGDSAIEGPNQIALLLAAALAALIGLYQGRRWPRLQEGMLNVIQVVITPILMLLLIGAMASTWMVSGIVPTIIIYGLKLADPAWFYAGAALACAIVSTAIGSSWTTAATIGVAMMATGDGL
ncbi:MAG TPA: hypothetical protein DIW43_07875, partial [Spongiibacteraceae bacterium]|nr:hypothetical protein [Spongiibacteraceae bacterium]